MCFQNLWWIYFDFFSLCYHHVCWWNSDLCFLSLLMLVFSMFLPLSLHTANVFASSSHCLKPSICLPLKSPAMFQSWHLRFHRFLFIVINSLFDRDFITYQAFFPSWAWLASIHQVPIKYLSFVYFHNSCCVALRLRMCRFVFCCIVLCRIVLYCICCVVLCRIVIVLYCAVSYCVVLYCVVQRLLYVGCLCFKGIVETYINLFQLFL